MAILYQAELRPSKIDLVAAWAPSQPWFAGDAAAGFSTVGAFRFDDPEGEVGIETLLVRAGDGPVLQVPLTYRGAALPGGGDALVGTTEHSVLGSRWVYDGTRDPAYVLAVVTAILTGASQADQYISVDGELVFREPTAIVVGSGTLGAAVPALAAVDGLAVRTDDGATIIEVDGLRLAVARVIDPPFADPDTTEDATPADTTIDGRQVEHTSVLAGTWGDLDTARTLVSLQRR
jgi:hypothetical protein